MRTSNAIPAVVTALLTAGVCFAANVVDQGAPGRQGPWPVYIQGLPDGGGGAGVAADGGASPEVALWLNGATLTGDGNFTWDHNGNLMLSVPASGTLLQDSSAGGCFEFPDAGGVCANTQWGQGGVSYGIEQDCSAIDGGNIQTSIFIDCLSSTIYMNNNTLYQNSSAIEMVGGQLEQLNPLGTFIVDLLDQNSDFSSSNGNSPGLILEDNAVGGGDEKARFAAVDGYSHLFYISQNIRNVAGDRRHDATANAQAMNGWEIEPDTFGAGTDATACINYLGYGPGAGILTAKVDFQMCLNGKEYVPSTVIADGGICFNDHTCQTTAASGYFIDGGGAVANPDVQLLPVVKGLYMNGEFDVYYNNDYSHKAFSVAGLGSGQIVGTDATAQKRYQFGGTTDNFLRDALYDGAIIHADGGFDAANQKLTQLANGTAATDAVAFGQIQETVTVTAISLPTITVSNSEVLGRQDSTSNQGLTLTRANIIVTCLIAGVGAGTTTLTLRDATTPTNLVTTTFGCACTPGASSPAGVVTGLTVPDTASLVIRTSASATTDCSTYPTVIANAMLSRN